VAYHHGFDGGFPPYVSAAERRKRAARALARLRKQGKAPQPVVIVGRAIASTFWGKAWCEHIEGHADLASRLPRGRAYARNGSVLDLAISTGEVRAVVSGTEVYEASVRVAPLPPARWKRVRAACAGQIATVVELLAGKLSSAVMEVLCHRTEGLFPATRELTMRCSCPDGAWLCKHLAAVLYGIGARLDHAPELLFTLRGVEVAALAAEAGKVGALAGKAAGGAGLAREELADVFGIELEGGPGASPPQVTARARGAAKPRPRRGKAGAEPPPAAPRTKGAARRTHPRPRRAQGPGNR
jgi:uncharacterized Zn finger protein